MSPAHGFGSFCASSRAECDATTIGNERPAAAATGDPATWVREGEALASFPRADFADLADAHERGEDIVVLDVHRDSERANGSIEGSPHTPFHELHDRAADVPDGTVWVHCAGGTRSATAASLLDATGRKVIAIEDSFEAPTDTGLSITRP